VRPLLGGSSSEPTATPATETTPAVVGTPGGAPPPATPAAGGTPVAATAKLTSFSRFDRKDPFVQQVATTPPAAPAGGASSSSAKTGKTEKPEGSGTATFSTGGKAGADSATIVTVNGARQVVEPGSKFPSTDPLFVLVAEKPGAKSVVVGIAGGAYSGGRKTTTLRLGKPLTLVNTATGAKYKVTLVSVGSGEKAAD
jgi:hypothetical protein